MVVGASHSAQEPATVHFQKAVKPMTDLKRTLTFLKMALCFSVNGPAIPTNAPALSVNAPAFLCKTALQFLENAPAFAEKWPCNLKMYLQLCLASLSPGGYLRSSSNRHCPVAVIRTSSTCSRLSQNQKLQRLMITSLDLSSPHHIQHIGA